MVLLLILTCELANVSSLVPVTVMNILLNLESIMLLNFGQTGKCERRVHRLLLRKRHLLMSQVSAISDTILNYSRIRDSDLELMDK